MDVILHIGAHRCATTTFQHYMRMNADRLGDIGIGFWGPKRTRGGLLAGILPQASPARGRDLRRRGLGRVRMHLERAAQSGTARLVISDENMMGSVRENLMRGGLYDGVGQRLARLGEAFEGRVSDVVLNVRSLDAYWTSALGYGLVRGQFLPQPVLLDKLAGSARSWRDVITDVACALPATRLWVLPHETFGGRPDAQLRGLIGADTPRSHARGWLNATPHLPELRSMIANGALPVGDGRWTPFDAAQTAALREAYADDMMWLTAGAEGLAQLMDDPDKKAAGTNPTASDLTRGKRDDDQESRMAGTG